METIALFPRPAIPVTRYLSMLLVLCSNQLCLFAQKPNTAPDLGDLPPVYFSFRSAATGSKQVVVPFDRKFPLVVTKFPFTNPKEAYLYLAEYQNGRRQLVRSLKSDNLLLDIEALKRQYSSQLSAGERNRFNQYVQENPDHLAPGVLAVVKQYPIGVKTLKKLISGYPENYVAEPQCAVDVTASNDSLTLSMPAIRPAKYFDVRIVCGLGSAAMTNLLLVNKYLMLGDDVNGKKYFTKLVKETADISYPGFVFQALRLGSYTDYKRLFDTSGLKAFYQAMANTAAIPRQAYPHKDSLSLAAVLLTRNKIKFDKVFLARRLLIDSSLDDMASGVLPADYQTLTKSADLSDFDSRVKNLTNSISFFDSLSIVVNSIVVRGTGDSLLFTLQQINAVNDSLKKTLTLLKTNYKAVLDYTDNNNNIRQSVMLTGDAFAPDLLTRANFLITTDMGITNIWAKDNRNTVNWLPKLFFGINIFFRRTDKNASFKDLPWKWHERGLLSSRNPWQYVSLSLGTTIGSMTTKSFDNLYNSFSFTLGPSVRFSKAFRFTTGMALLRRTKQNPLESDKEITWGPFAAFSIDVDLLTPAKNVTSLFFK